MRYMKVEQLLPWEPRLKAEAKSVKEPCILFQMMNLKLQDLSYHFDPVLKLAFWLKIAF